jgi:hypothetical protein
MAAHRERSDCELTPLGRHSAQGLVGHQADQKDPGLITVARLGHGVEQALAISVALQIRVPFVAAKRCMANRPVECDASWMRQMPPLPNPRPEFNPYILFWGLTPWMFDPMDVHQRLLRSGDRRGREPELAAAPGLGHLPGDRSWVDCLCFWTAPGRLISGLEGRLRFRLVLSFDPPE